VGVRTLALGVNAPPLLSAGHDAVHAYVSVWLSESVALTVTATWPAAATGFGTPPGPDVIVKVCAGGVPALMFCT
jgi:hypothetical protein